MAKGRGTIRNGLMAALDVGSNKTCCFIAKPDQLRASRRWSASASRSARASRAAPWSTWRAAETSILNAVHAAEQMAGETHRGSGGQPVRRLPGLQQRRRRGLDRRPRGRPTADLRRAVDQCQALDGANGNGDRTTERADPLHPDRYSIDGSRGIRDPRGMFGQTRSASPALRHRQAPARCATC